MKRSGRGLPLTGKGKKKDGNREMIRQRVESHKLSSADCPVALGWAVARGITGLCRPSESMLHSALGSDVGQAASVVRQCVPNGDGRSLVQIGFPHPPPVQYWLNDMQTVSLRPSAMF